MEKSFFEKLHDRLPDIVAWGLVASTLLLSGWGRLADGVQPMAIFFAAVFILFQLATNMMAVWARTLTLARWPSVFGCLVAMVVFGLFSHESLKHAWGEAAERGYVDPASWLSTTLLLFLPFAEPFLFWVRRLLWETDKSEAQQAQERADQLWREERERDRKHALDLASTPLAGRSRTLARHATAAALGVSMATSPAAAFDHDTLPMLEPTTDNVQGFEHTPQLRLQTAPAPKAKARRPATRKTRVPLNYKDREALARQLLLERPGAMASEIAAEAGISRTSVWRISRAMSPLATAELAEPDSAPLPGEYAAAS